MGMIIMLVVYLFLGDVRSTLIQTVSVGHTHRRRGAPQVQAIDSSTQTYRRIWHRNRSGRIPRQFSSRDEASWLAEGNFGPTARTIFRDVLSPEPHGGQSRSEVDRVAPQ